MKTYWSVDSYMSVSFKRKRFYKEYLIDGNGTAAAIRAGYSPKTAQVQASQMLADPDGQKYMNELLTDLDQLLELTAADVRNEVGKLATSDVRGIFNEDGTLKAPHELDEHTAAAIASIKIKRDPILGDQYEYKFHSKVAALENLTKQHNLYEANQKAGAGEIHLHIDEKDAQA